MKATPDGDRELARSIVQRVRSAVLA